MAYELEVPVRHRTLWLAFTDPERMARAVPGLTVDAVQTVPAADSPEGVSGDVVAGRLKLRVGGTGSSGTTITYRGTARISAAEAQAGTLEVSVDVAQARGNGAMAGALRIALRPSGDAGERTAVSVTPDLELSGRALDFKRDELIAAAAVLAGQWLSALAEEYQDTVQVAADAAVADVVEAAPVVHDAPEVAEAVVEAAVQAARAVEASIEQAEAAAPAATEVATEAEAEAVPESEPEAAPATAGRAPVVPVLPVLPVVPAADPLIDDSLSEDPLASVWRGEYEKDMRLTIAAALAILLLVRRRRRRNRRSS